MEGKKYVRIGIFLILCSFVFGACFATAAGQIGVDASDRTLDAAMRASYTNVSQSFSITGVILTSGCLLIGIILFWLARRASDDIKSSFNIEERQEGEKNA